MRKQEIIDLFRKVSWGITEAGLDIAVTDDSVLSQKVKVRAIEQLLKAQEIIIKVMNEDIKANMKEEE